MKTTVARKVGSRKSYPKTPLLNQTKALLGHLGLKARKRLGQHFLVDEEALKTIVSAAKLTSTDFIIEIGPGLGLLTRELAKKAGWVVAVELDNQLASALKKTLAWAKNVTIINEDILHIELSALLEEPRASLPPAIAGSPGYKVVANLPYYITSAVVRHFLEAWVKPRLMVVMVQKEVAEAMVAKPGGMSLLSVSVQFYGQPEIISYVPARCFYPAPEVDSAILRITLYPEPAVVVTDDKSFFRLVRAGFTAPRKQLVNSLAQGLRVPKSEALPLLEEAGIASKRRAETLALEEWAKLWQAFSRVRQLSC